MSGSAFIFDMDGTLIDNMRFHGLAWFELLAAAGAAVDAAHFFARAAGKTNADIVRQFVGPDLTEAEVFAYGERKEARYRELYRPHLKPVAGLLDFLSAAHAAGIPMAVATSAGKTNVALTLAGLGIEAFFQTVVSGEDVRRGKPHPEMFLQAAGRLGIVPERCIVFEDSPAGIEAAGRAGMKVVVLTTSLAAGDVDGQGAALRAAPDYTALDPLHLLGHH